MAKKKRSEKVPLNPEGVTRLILSLAMFPREDLKLALRIQQIVRKPPRRFGNSAACLSFGRQFAVAHLFTSWSSDEELHVKRCNYCKAVAKACQMHLKDTA